MLRQLAIRNVVLIDSLELEFDSGLGVLTGETGAGKSILLDSLGLALGARSDSGLVRQSAESASVSAEIELPAQHPAIALLRAQDIAIEPGEPLLLRRTVKSDGGSRAFVGSTPVSAATLREFAALAVEMHGQHDDRGLLNPRGHRALLDESGRVETAAVAAAWDRVTEIEQSLAQARAEAASAERDREYLAHAAAEIEALAPEPGEETRLAEDRSAMQAGAKTGDALDGLDELLGGSDGALARMRQVARRLERGAADHPLLAEALAALDRALIEAHEAEDRIARAAQALAFDPARLESVEARLFDIRGLARKHRVEPDALAELGEMLRAQLTEIEAGGERIEMLDAQLQQARRDYSQLAAALSEQRRAAAARLDGAVAAELAPLKLDSARFRTTFAQAEPGASGTDRVEFEISTNPGAAFGPLTRIASGGELSRFILALKVALAEAGTASTMIFDEIDRGVGGAVASAIGERLARLAKRSQVLVVTHSPQVAARASHHYRIEKSHEDGSTRTIVRRLSADERREEIARMLSGAAVTDEARAQAARLLESGVTGYVALLRAVNVGGTSKLPMSDLQRIAADAGFENPRTYIASGNLLFSSRLEEQAARELIEARLEQHLSKRVPVMIRSASELAQVARINPFTNAPPRRVLVTFLPEPPTDALDQARGLDGERLALGKREIYVDYCGRLLGRSRLRIPAAEAGTAHNMNTVAKLAELAQEMA